MMRWLTMASAAALLCSCATADDTQSVTNAPLPQFDESAYALCAACHLADGAGIPGAFPPIRNRTAEIAKLAGGRDYLITAVSSGLVGTIDVGGQLYAGAMPGNRALLPPETIAEAINYSIFQLLDDPGSAAGIAPVTTTEVEAIQADSSLSMPQAAVDMRAALAERNGGSLP